MSGVGLGWAPVRGAVDARGQCDCAHYLARRVFR